MRTVREWIGKTDDTPPPPRVKVRVRDRFNGICQLCKFPAILPHIDHITALINGGQNREANLQPVCRACHAEKSKDDVAIKAKVARIAKKHMGIRRAGRTIPGRRFDGTPIPARDR